MNAFPPLVAPEVLFSEMYRDVLSLVTEHSPFPQSRNNLFSHGAKARAARIHLEETVFFGQVVYQDLTPTETVEVCSGFGIPTITMNKLFGVQGTCVDSSGEKLAIGKTISEKFGITITWEQRDVFVFLRQNAQQLGGRTLLATAAYCQDKKNVRPKGSGESDIVEFARNNGMNLALFPFRTADIVQRGVSSERNRVASYAQRLADAGYLVKKHSTEALFRGQGAPEWFFVEMLTAKCSS